MRKWLIAALVCALLGGAGAWLYQRTTEGKEKLLLNEQTLNEQLLISVKSGDVEFVKQILSRGANPRQEDLHHMPLTYYAAKHRDPKLMAVLIEAGAIVNPVMTKAEYIHNYEPAKLFDANSMQDKDEKQLASLFGTCRLSPLTAATAEGNYEVVMLLLDAGAKIKPYDFVSTSALNAAAESDSIEIARELIKRGADLNTVNYMRETPLCTAAENGNEELVLLLLEHGATFTNYERRSLESMHSPRVDEFLERLDGQSEQADAGV